MGLNVHTAATRKVAVLAIWLSSFLLFASPAGAQPLPELAFSQAQAVIGLPDCIADDTPGDPAELAGDSLAIPVLSHVPCTFRPDIRAAVEPDFSLRPALVQFSRARDPPAITA